MMDNLERVDPTVLVDPPSRSRNIDALAAALAKAQGEMEGAAKGSLNPHFKNKYADLASIWDACRSPLSKHGLSILQPVSADGPKVTVTTILAHSSGQWISESLTMTAQQNTPQGVGSAITYGRRYGLAAMVGIAPEDDDGNAASARPARQQEQPIERSVVDEPAPQRPDGYTDWLEDLAAVADEGSSPLEATWKKSNPEYRRYLTKTNPAGWDALKAKAAQVRPTVGAAS